MSANSHRVDDPDKNCHTFWVDRFMSCTINDALRVKQSNMHVKDGEVPEWLPRLIDLLSGGREFRIVIRNEETK